MVSEEEDVSNNNEYHSETKVLQKIGYSEGATLDEAIEENESSSDNHSSSEELKVFKRTLARLDAQP